MFVGVVPSLVSSSLFAGCAYRLRNNSRRRRYFTPAGPAETCLTLVFLNPYPHGVFLLKEISANTVYSYHLLDFHCILASPTFEKLYGKNHIIAKENIVKRCALKSRVALMITLLLSVALVTLAPRTMANETIYIRADGIIDPSTAPIQRNGESYTLTGNISDSIGVERNRIALDGAGYTVESQSAFALIYLLGANNVTIKNMKFDAHVWSIYASSDNSISGNNFRTMLGINMSGVSGNVVFEK